MSWRVGVSLLLLGCLEVQAQSQVGTSCQSHTDGGHVFSLEQVHDSLSLLVLTGADGHSDTWQLSYPVYQFQTGDVDGDGVDDAMVGVIKSTRFYPEKARRLFIFKNKNGYVRPMWMGSKLGGILVDFRYADGRIRSLERTVDNRYFVAEYRWQGFGMVFERFLATNLTEQQGQESFSHN